MAVDYAQLNLKSNYWCCGSVEVTGADGKSQVCTCVCCFCVVCLVWEPMYARWPVLRALPLRESGLLHAPFSRLIHPYGLAVRRQHLGWGYDHAQVNTADLLPGVRERRTWQPRATHQIQTSQACLFVQRSTTWNPEQQLVGRQ